jgi:hypothetical protein
MLFCWKCGTKLEQGAKYCSKCGIAADFKEVPESISFFGDKKNFIIQSYWESRWDIGCIMDLDKNILAFFGYSETWKPTRTRVASTAAGRSPDSGMTADFRIETVDGVLIGEIIGFAPLLYSWVRRNSYEIYDIKNRLLGIVWEKARRFGSKWVLENAEQEILATIEGSRKTKNYRVINPNNQVVARCYRSPEISEGFYRVEILESDLDVFLILNYVIVLDRVKRYLMGGS